MTINDLPPRQKSQRLVNKIKSHQPSKPMKKLITDNNLYPGINDITDAFEALPLDLIKFFTSLKEIDAKCINLIPNLNYLIKNFISNRELSKAEKEVKLDEIKELIKELMPCIEEKMHVATVASDLVSKHLTRIDDDYKIILNNEIPDSIRIGPLNHPAMIMDSKLPDNKTSQSQRSESRREALAAKKATTNDEDDGKKSKNSSNKNQTNSKETTPSSTAQTNPKKRNRNLTVSSTNLNFKENEAEDISRPGTPQPKKRQPAKKKTKDDCPINSPMQPLIKDNQDESNNEQDEPVSPTSIEPLYCYCNQVSFGEMVGCDGNDCKREWFHLPCIGLRHIPKGKWYCEDCLNKLKKKK